MTAETVLEQEKAQALHLRNCLGRFPTGVAIVATRPEGSDTPHAMTASSFLSVSLRPALALVSVSSEARMHKELLRAERFSVSVLEESQRVSALQFAGQPVEEPVRLVSRSGVPLIEPALVTFVLVRRSVVNAGDHCLHIGEVEDCWARDGDPLLHFRGAFRQLRDDVESVTPSGLAWWAEDSPW